MPIRRTTQFLLTVLVLGAAALGTRSVASAADRIPWPNQKAPALPTMTFGTTTRWETIAGTRVARVTETSRPSYDLFRYGSRYYAFNDGYWYRSNYADHGYVVVDDRFVPAALGAVPTDQWRSYPSGWTNPKNPHFAGRHDNGKHLGQIKNKDNNGAYGKGNDKSNDRPSRKSNGNGKH